MTRCRGLGSLRGGPGGTDGVSWRANCTGSRGGAAPRALAAAASRRPTSAWHVDTARLPCSAVWQSLVAQRRIAVARAGASAAGRPMCRRPGS